MSCNSTKCATCDGSCGDKPVARPSSPPMVSLPLSVYNHLVNLKDEVEKLRKQTEDPATEYDVRTMWCEACVGVAKERDELKSRLEFLYQEFGKAEADTLTRDALELKCRITEQERDDARAEVERLRAERDEARRDLGAILAVIHRDGGHHTGEHGLSQSVADAHATWASVVRRVR